MKNKIKKILNSLGLEIRRINHKRLSFDDIYSQKIKKNPIIFDVGANIGQSIIRFRKNFPDSIIHSFEPVEKEYVNLKKKFSDDKKLILNNFALGEKEYEKDFYINAKTGTSSFYKLKPNTEWLKIRSKEYKTKIQEFTTEVKQTKIVTLDSYCNKNNIKNIDILKLDTQGYEDKVLEGAIDILSKKNVKIVETEITFDDVYEKHINFYDIEKYLIKYNYRLVAMKRMYFESIYEGYMFGTEVMYISE